MRKERMTDWGGRPGRCVRVAQRRGSALVLVVALLGILFVTGIAFMASMNFEADAVAIEVANTQRGAGVEQVGDEAGRLLRLGFLVASGLPFGSEPVAHEVVVQDPNFPGVAAYFIPAKATYAEMPDVHPLIAQIEPDYDIFGNFAYSAFTDLSVLRTGTGATNNWSTDFISTSLPGGAGPGAIVDADGDGIVDSRQYSLEELGFSKAPFRNLAAQVNAPSRPDGDVFVGIRVIPHGGMVNVSESHPLLISSVLDRPGGYVHNPPYSPLTEEAQLRHRGGVLRRRVLPPTALHGNPFLDPDPDWPGEGDLTFQLFAQDETLYENDHRYRLYDIINVGGDLEEFRDRMTPENPQNPDNGTPAYDRAHLVTTVSYDDLLSRGGSLTAQEQSGVGETLHARMIAANQAAWDPDICPLLPFEYANYPHSIENNEECGCPTESFCEFNVRKGRLLLSLPWLDSATADGTIDAAQEQRLIHDVFMLLLRTAHGPAWDDSAGCNNDMECGDGFVCGPPPDGGPHASFDEWSGYGRRRVQAARTAASLTANMIDFADADDIPTRVALREPDMTDRLTAGRELSRGNPGLNGAPGPAYVYGLERQPYISEIATEAYDDDGDAGGGYIRAWAIELFNPYEVDLDKDVVSYSLWEVNPNDPDPIGSANVVPLRQDIRLGEMTVFVYETMASFPDMIPSNGRVHLLDTPLTFENGWILYLVRNVLYPGDTNPTAIVVDQITVNGARIARADESVFAGMPANPDRVVAYAMERSITANAPWDAPYPQAIEGNLPGESLGQFAPSQDDWLRPIEVQFANTGDYAAAFPTTGSMLLLMRHANREIMDYPAVVTGGADAHDRLAFTSWLDDEITVSIYDGTWDPATGRPIVTGSVVVSGKSQIDNGRMPIFDVGGVHHDQPVHTEQNAPGDLETLPWGQFVFDYFTALPLSSGGPYDNPDNDPEFVPDPASGPRVDLSGLRVHGRININSAPWRVLAGLPMMPASAFDGYPDALRTKIKESALLSENDAEPIRSALAKAIVAYREDRELTADIGGMFGTTGDYGPNGGNAGRSWGTPLPAARRGTGFMSVGELANVRHAAATATGIPGFNQGSYFRFDNGYVGSTDGTQDFEDYVSAVAPLVALGDWLTVRSQVFTVYGTFRGELDANGGETPRDVDARAVRFQVTLDRLPTFLGQPLPRQIGQQTSGGYADALND